MNLSSQTRDRSGLLRNDFSITWSSAHRWCSFPLCSDIREGFEYDAKALIPFIGNGPLIFLNVSTIWQQKGEPVPGHLGMAIRPAHL